MLHSFPVYMQYCEWFAFLRTFVLHSICNMSTPCNTMNILDYEFFISRRQIGPGREIIKCLMSVRACVRVCVRASVRHVL